MSGDDSGLEVGDMGKVSDALIRSIYGSKQHIRLEKIFGDHRVFAPFNSKLSMMFIITLPYAESIMSAQTNETVDGYTLENIELEYETIDHQNLAQESSSKYDTGRSLLYKHITHVKALNWSKDSTIENETINFPRKSLKAVVVLFRNKTITDSEEFVFPNIETVKVTIEGVPNQIYGQEIPKNSSRLFGNGAENPENNKLISENAKLVSENNKLISENNKLISENNKLILENAKLVSENNKLVSENNNLILENTKLITENNKLILENAKLITENTKLITENTKLISENNKLISENT